MKNKMKIKYIFQALIITLIVLSVFSCGLLSRKYEKKETVEYKFNTQNKTKISFKNVWKVSTGVGIDSNLKIATTCHKMRKQIMAAVPYIARVILSSNLILSSLYVTSIFWGCILLYLFYPNV